jgi:hypothetical protein
MTYAYQKDITEFTQNLHTVKINPKPMKTLSILLLSLIFSHAFSQEVLEKEVKSEISEVTVFLEGAQILQKKSVELPKGITILKFVNLSPFIDAKSVQVRAEGEVMVLAVNHQQNFLSESEKSIQVKDLEKQLETIEDKIRLENTYLSILKEELGFLQDNRAIGGKSEQVSISNLQQTSDFYSTRLTSLKLKEIERIKNLKTLNDQKNNFQNQLNTLTSKKEYPMGEILVKVDAKIAKSFSFELTYLVANAGWFPSYDIRAKNVNEPVQLVYKANVKQDTKADWSNVKLKFSTADPNVSGVAPQMRPYFLDYNSRPPTYQKTGNSVRGRVFDESGNPLPGANVSVKGTTIATVTDYDGNYSITIPSSASQLSFSFIGFATKNLTINNSVMNISLNPDQASLSEVMVSSKAMRSSSVMDQDMRSADKMPSLAVPTQQTENQTTVDFEIKTPYTIKSDNKNYTVDLDVYDLPAFYQYYAVPKIEKDAFLIAYMTDWEKYNLLEGEANVFFEETYVGKTILDVRSAGDTLEISLGRDKKVSIDREKSADFTSKQFVGSKKEETRAWKTTIRNTKNQAIKMIILDQVPVSTLEEIEIAIQTISGAKHDSATGELKWEFELKPAEKKELDLKYSIKYPKNRSLIIE